MAKVRKFTFPYNDYQAVAQIRKLPKKHQEWIGRIVWWDWFAVRPVLERTSRFDQWLTYSEKPEPPVQDLLKSLMAFGYPEWLAIRRLQIKTK